MTRQEYQHQRRRLIAALADYRATRALLWEQRGALRRRPLVRRMWAYLRLLVELVEGSLAIRAGELLLRRMPAIGEREWSR